jgi:hypothetical protein
MRRILIFCCILALAFAACTSSDLPVEKKPAAKDTSGITGDTANRMEITGDRHSIQEKFRLWNEASNKRDAKALGNLYGEEINLYGEALGNEEAVNSRRTFFDTNRNYSQVLTAVKTEELSATETRISFQKDFTAAGKKQSVPAYLKFEKFDTGWKIVAESDVASDKEVEEQAGRNIPESEITSCDKAAEAIFLSSAEVKTLLKRKFARYELEYTPDAADNPNRRYWFWIYTAQPNSGKADPGEHFQVDPLNGQLFEYNSLQDQAVAIPYNSSLRRYIQRFCGRKQ